MSKRMIDTLLHDGCSIVGGPLQEDFREAEVLIVDNVSTYFYENMRELPSKWSRGDFPNCAPPYPLFWMETRTPSFGRENRAHIPLDRIYAWGALFFATDLPGLPTAKRQVVSETLRTQISDLPLTALADVKWWMVVIPMVQPFPNTDSLRDLNLVGHFLIQANGQMLQWKRQEGTNAFALASTQGEQLKKDAEGMHVEMDSAWKYIDSGKIPTLSPQELQTRVDNAHALLSPLWLAISFLHCKNVTTARVDPCHPRGKKKASMCCPRVHYHTLNIHPMREVLRREGNQESTGLKNALHICRGHFRDYSQGRGLFGKHKGLYWFDQHLRGSSEYGVVVKDYMIHPY